MAAILRPRHYRFLLKKRGFVNLRRTGLVACAGALLAVFALPRTSSSQQKFDKFKEQQGMQMLDEIHNQVKKHYYDPTFHGVDIEKVFAGARDQMKGVDVLNKDFAIIGDALDALRDSHTFFIPPRGISLSTTAFATK